MTSCKEAIKDIEIDGKVAAEVRAPPAAEPRPEAVVLVEEGGHATDARATHGLCGGRWRRCGCARSRT